MRGAPLPNPGAECCALPEGEECPRRWECLPKGIALPEGGSTATRRECFSKGIALSRAGVAGRSRLRWELR